MPDWNEVLQEITQLDRITITPQPQVFGMPGRTASGIASASQLVDLTETRTFRADMTASPRPLLVFVPGPSQRQIETVPLVTPLTADDYPVLAAIWDNEEDDIFNSL